MKNFCTHILSQSSSSAFGSSLASPKRQQSNWLRVTSLSIIPFTNSRAPLLPKRTGEGDQEQQQWASNFLQS
ncbi:hypothetical protein R1flu_022191 [Riccia fluitans]|uniref:Uncharacterized protein n=1 Tax=Riccia fluitans TaxID=41844 RepID=A0ABD1ZRP7_9MARC